MRVIYFPDFSILIYILFYKENTDGQFAPYDIVCIISIWHIYIFM